MFIASLQLLFISPPSKTVMAETEIFLMLAVQKCLCPKHPSLTLEETEKTTDEKGAVPHPIHDTITTHWYVFTY